MIDEERSGGSDSVSCSATWALVGRRPILRRPRDAFGNACGACSLANATQWFRRADDSVGSPMKLADRVALLGWPVTLHHR